MNVQSTTSTEVSPRLEASRPENVLNQKLQLNIEKLIACESGGNESAVNNEDALITGSPSVGVLQFQESTFVHYAKLYNLFPNAEENELENLWPGKDAQIKVATAMLEDGLYGHWRNCSIAIGIL